MARRDYFYDPEAPKPNSIRPAAAVALLDSGGHILLLRRKDNDKWTLPGTLDFGESLTDYAIREVREETGLQIRITGLIGTYTDPHILLRTATAKSGRNSHSFMLRGSNPAS
jgi:ADP-ribose pyrophosphatase YjhB (NUDIX family)